jgi:hypothetical protein
MIDCTEVAVGGEKAAKQRLHRPQLAGRHLRSAIPGGRPACSARSCRGLERGFAPRRRSSGSEARTVAAVDLRRGVRAPVGRGGRRGDALATRARNDVGSWVRVRRAGASS